MGRKKAQPIRSGRFVTEVNAANCSKAQDSVDGSWNEEVDRDRNKEVHELQNPIYVDVDRSNWTSDEHFDIAEVCLNNVRFSDTIVDYASFCDGLGKCKYSLRFCLYGVNKEKLRLGQWPNLDASDNIYIECLILESHSSEDMEPDTVLFSGTFDGPDKSVSALVHLVSLKFVSLRLLCMIEGISEVPFFRFRIEILKSAFDACNSLLETTRFPWRKSIMNVMNWLRPEVTTSETIYGIEGPISKVDEDDTFIQNKRTNFDVTSFYEAIRPSREETMLDEELPDLLPRLRLYQRRAAFWMVQQEKRVTIPSEEQRGRQLAAPYSVPVAFLDRSSGMFYNPFSGSISLCPEPLLSEVSGGILADEMGLGKTVELLACIFAHPRTTLEGRSICEDLTQDARGQIKRQKLERVECICGAASVSSKYKGSWVQCDFCDAWQHADCIGYMPKKEVSQTPHAMKEKRSEKKNSREKKDDEVIHKTDNEYICPLCSELIDAIKIKRNTGATLIICPAPILSQWNSEIIRHTRCGSLKVCIYEGAKSLDSLANLRTRMNELADADIVLTTYDTLREDLSHDSDRHDGDRHFLRFQKRYPVVPTLLTRIHWWRLCLDEAQMVECNQASVTEMAIRIHAEHRWCITGTPIQRRFDDMYGLLRFLRASPFDIYRWWAEVVRDPYERKDLTAMKFVHKYFKQIMWRSSKVHVAEEVELPPQEEYLSWLTFSSIEEHFYQKQHETCVKVAHDMIKSLKHDICKREQVAGFDASGNTFLSPSEFAKFVGPLLKLRQACCHPQVGSSGLCSLQQNPLTMGEILEVLIGKAKTEGEEALRKIVSSLNGLAAIATIEEDDKRAVSFYLESLALADENSDDFRLDPLLNLHIHHNMADLLSRSSESSQYCICHQVGEQTLEMNGIKKQRICVTGRIGKHYIRRNTNEHRNSVSDTDNTSLDQCEKLADDTFPVTAFNTGEKDLQINEFQKQEIGVPGKFGKYYVRRRRNIEHRIPVSDSDNTSLNQCKKDGHHHLFEGTEVNDAQRVSPRCYNINCLRKFVQKMKEKYLSLFSSKMFLARKEFNYSFLQVSSTYDELQNDTAAWWLNALNHINKESFEELIRKIDQAISKIAHNEGSTRVSSRFRSVSTLIYSIKTGLDSLQNARQVLIDRLREIDRTMDNPRDDDVESIRNCPKCYDGNGPLCIHCELDGLFQAYEARLSFVRKLDNNRTIASVEEALDFQERNLELNSFFFHNKRADFHNASKDDKRHVAGNVQILKIPSQLEIILKIIKSYSKAVLGRKDMEFASKHLLIFEAMRKEYAQARSLSTAQAQVLRAYDEIRMATTRLHLKVTEEGPITTDVLGREELVSASMQLSSEKLVSLSSLQSIKGQLRYLKGMILSGMNVQNKNLGLSSRPQVSTGSTPAAEGSGTIHRKYDETCPICHEKILDQKMVFECGHVVCCKCCLELTEYAVLHAKDQQKWVMCPTCRRRTDFENIAYADEKKALDADDDLQTESALERSIVIKGSYGTKIEAVTRRILRITSSNQEAKVLVFSGWNDVLDVLGHALNANDITYVRMKGGRQSKIAISQFKGQEVIRGGLKPKRQKRESKPVQVLMMLIQNGANGLNLLEAQHVILTEPLLNPAAEAQAISRVHRIGQDKKTFVHRFLVKNTIEESIYKLNQSRSATSLASTSRVSKKQDQPSLTLEDLETLFTWSRPAVLQEGGVSEEEEQTASFRDQPPAVAAGLAAQRRLMEGQSDAPST